MARYESNICRIALQCFLQPKMIPLMLGRNHDKGIRPNRGFREIKVLCDQPICLWERIPLSSGIVDSNGKAHQVPKSGKCLCDASMANEQKFRFGKNGFNENVHDSSAGHSYPQWLVCHIHSNHPWLPGFYGFERFAFDGAFSAASSDP